MARHLIPMQALVVLVLVVVLSDLRWITAAAPANPDDAAAMRSIANTTGATKLLGWGAKSADPCDGTWTGVRCNGEGRVTSISASRAGLNGFIDGPDLSKLSFLAELDVSFNRLLGGEDGGNLPLLPTPLQHLRSLDFRSNNYGRIPEGFFAGFPALETIALDDNEMTARRFFLDVLTCSNLRSFSANNISLLCDFPDFFGNPVAFPVLERLSLARNAIFGPISPTFGRNSQIKYLDISDQTHDFDTGLSTLMGRIDQFIAGIESLVEVRLDHNSLSGPLPDVTKLHNLQVFNAVGNDFCGVPNFAKGTSVDLTGNPNIGKPC